MLISGRWAEEGRGNEKGDDEDEDGEENEEEEKANITK